LPKLARRLQQRRCQMRKLFAHKQGFPGDRAPLVREARVVPGVLYAAATDALAPRHVVKGRLG